MGSNLNKVMGKLSEKAKSEQKLEKVAITKAMWGGAFRPRTASAEAVSRASMMPTFRVCHPHVTPCQWCPLEMCHAQCAVRNMADLS